MFHIVTSILYVIVRCSNEECAMAARVAITQLSLIRRFLWRILAFSKERALSMFNKSSYTKAGEVIAEGSIRAVLNSLENGTETILRSRSYEEPASLSFLSRPWECASYR